MHMLLLQRDIIMLINRIALSLLTLNFNSVLEHIAREYINAIIIVTVHLSHNARN